MHEMQTIVTYDPGVCLSVCLVCLSHGSNLHYCARMVERIKILFGVNTRGGPRTIGRSGSGSPRSEGRGIRCSLR